ncbi:Alpha-tubulin suppressor [Parafrankia irregularis]|uniref:Alpha-tubulin suppressor n=1 Tax=Parafrankia irregularis TaxID=795642 RepID=A0A0S4QLX6_9ACTN|nr:MULTISPECIES: RCC1 repeat- and reductase domain-containing protein [Parafrankia]MBE3201111.1 RCC1 repeat- and reductase domain-containing protein [Parafrankia sp. CH37]CUU56461.1 Alpha-tubulin suppressor [Parafrankia irregularis]
MPSQQRRIGTWAVVLAAAGAVALPTAASAAPKPDGPSAEAEYAFAPPTYTARAWGLNDAGQLGNGTTSPTPSFSPVPVTDLTGLDDVRAIAGGYGSGYALNSDGTVWAWGLNTLGQLGNGTVINSNVPVQVAGLDDIRAIAAGTDGNGYALRRDGTVWAWGVNTLGQLGNGQPIASSTIPVQVVGLTGIRAIAADGSTAYALRRDGSVWAWGSNGAGQLGTGQPIASSPLPIQIVALSDIRAITARNASAYALRRDGTVWAWGDNPSGELGNGTLTPSLTPGPVLNLTKIRRIAAGAGVAYALDETGTVWAWGANAVGQLGNGTLTPSLLPVPVTGETGLVGAVAIAAGASTVYALRWDGTAFAWGVNNVGQLGNGNPSVPQSSVPLPIPGLGDVRAITGGLFDGYAIVSSGF